MGCSPAGIDSSSMSRLQRNMVFQKINISKDRHFRTCLDDLVQCLIFFFSYQNRMLYLLFWSHHHFSWHVAPLRRFCIHLLNSFSSGIETQENSFGAFSYIGWIVPPHSVFPYMILLLSLSIFNLQPCCVLLREIYSHICSHTFFILILYIVPLFLSLQLTI